MFRSLFLFLSSLFRRDGLATIGKLFRYAFSPRAWRWLLAGIRNKRLLKSSGLFDEAWYRREYPDVVEKGIDPVQDYLTPPHPWLRLPNPDFVPREYAAMNFDVKACGIPWAVHYAKDGMREGRPVSTLENYEKPFPVGAVELRRAFAAAPVVHRRTAVFASFSGDGRIKESVLFYLRGLREVTDNIVFIANNPIFPDEVEKLDGLVRLAVFHHHGCYDFGSYKSGWNEAKAIGLLEPDICDELVVCNDSCYGPVFPFSETFAEMDRRNCEAKPGERFDFWGMASMCIYGKHAIQSFFYVFRKSVLESGTLDHWFEKMQLFRDRGRIVFFCESALTAFLTGGGHRWDSLVPESFHSEKKATPTKYPLILLRDFRMPLVKVKALKGDCLDDLQETLDYIASENPAMAAFLSERRKSAGGNADGAVVQTASATHVDSLETKVSAIRKAYADGRPVRVVFLVSSIDPHPARDIVARLASTPGFSVSVSAVPDLRIQQIPDRFSVLRDMRAALLSRFPAESVVRAEPDASGEWNDLAANADLVCYETAENISDFRYNPHYAIGRNFLPVLFFDHRSAGPYPLEKEFARQNYAYFWKIFFTDRDSFDLYARHSLRKGANAVLSEGGNVAAAISDIVAELLPA